MKRELEELMAVHEQSHKDNEDEVMQQEPIKSEQDDYAVEEDSSYPLDGLNDANEQWWRRRHWYRRRKQQRRRRRKQRNQRKRNKSQRSRQKSQRKRQRSQRSRQRNQVTTTGVTYTRFGKSSCRSGAEVVYKGVVAGSYYYHKGGGSNYLCLPDHPEYSGYRSGVQGYSYIYGTEYEYPLKRAHHDHNVPCAVCYAPKRSTSLMIPAKINCPRSFTKEYVGYLMSARYGHYRTEYICVDKDQDSVRGSSRNTNGALVYHVEVACHYGIPCSPYNRQKELTCVVCSR